MTAPPRLHLVLIGGFRVLIDGSPVEIPKQKALALLALLAIAAPHRISRALVRGLLWTDSSEADAQNSLRNALWLLRAVFDKYGFPGLQANRAELWLEPDSFVTDLDDVRAGLASGRIAQPLFADQGFPGSLLAGLMVTDLFEQRLATFRQSIVGDLASIVAQAVTRLADDQRSDMLSLLTELQPLNEAHHRALIQHLIASDRKADALAAYQRLWSILDEEFGEEPSAGTQAVIIALKQAEDVAIAADPPRPVIVVRLEALTAAPAESLSRMRDALQLTLSALARFREWRIIDGRYDPDLAALRRQANEKVFVLALSVLEGTAAPPRLSAILTDAGNGQILWSDQLGRAFPIEPQTLDTAIRRFATAINLLLSGSDRPRPAISAHIQTDHYELWIEAQQKMREFTPRGWVEAEQALDRILVENPQHSRVLATRASIETMRQIAFPGVISTPNLHRRALKWASTAALIDPIDSRAQLALAWACAMSRQFDRAEVAFELAFQHNENDPWTIASCLVGFAFCDRGARARAMASYLGELGLALEPFHWSYLAAAHFLLGDDAACVTCSKLAQEVSSDVSAWHAAALAHLGQTDEASSVAGRFLTSARAGWTPQQTPHDSEIAAWLLSCFPIRSRTQWNRLRKGLALAGVPVPGL